MGYTLIFLVKLAAHFYYSFDYYLDDTVMTMLMVAIMIMNTMVVMITVTTAVKLIVMMTRRNMKRLVKEKVDIVHSSSLL